MPSIDYVVSVSWSDLAVLSAAGGTATPVIEVTAKKKGTSTVLAVETPQLLSVTFPESDWVSVDASGAVTTVDRGAVVGISRSVLGAVKVLMSNGVEVDGSFVLTQAGNEVESLWFDNLSLSYPAVGALGGDLVPSWSGTITTEYTSGAHGTVSVTDPAVSITSSSYTISEPAGWVSVADAAMGRLSVSENQTLSSRESGSISASYSFEYGNATASHVFAIAPVVQSAGSYSYSGVTASLSYPSVAAIGGSSAPSISFSQTYGWNGKTSGAGTVTSYTKSSFTMGTTVGATIDAESGYITWVANQTSVARESALVSVTVTGANNASAILTATSSQAAGVQTSETHYSSWVTESLTVTSSVATIDAGGGSSTLSCSAHQSRTKYVDTLWNGIVTDTVASTEQQTVVVTPTWSKSGDGTLSSTTAKNPTLTYASRGTAVGDTRSTTVTASYDGKTGSVSVSQSANATTSITYGTPSVTLSYPTASAGGGTVSPTLSYSQSRTQNYTSGSTSALSAVTSGGSVSYSKTSGSGTVNTSTGAVTVGSRGTTVDVTDTTVGVFSASVTLNGKSGSGSATLYQTRNQATSITYGTPSVSVSASDVPAKGGSVTSGTVTYSQSRTQNYTSGSTSALSALTSGGSVTWSGGASNIASLGTTERGRTAVGSALTATVTMNGKSGSGSTTVYQAANVRTQTGITISRSGSSADGWYVGSLNSIPAGRGDASDGSIFLYITGVYNYQFTSGSTSTVAIPSTIDITSTVTGSGWVWPYAPSYGTTNKRHVEIGNRTTVIGAARSGSVKWTVGGFTSNTIEFTQVLNKIVDFSFNYTGKYSPSTIAAAGGTSTFSWSGDYRGTYSSGNVAPINTTSISAAFSMPSTSGWSINSGTGIVTATNNTSTSARTSGKVSYTEVRSYTNPASVGGGKIQKTFSYDCGTVSQSAGYYTYSNITASMSYPETVAAGGTSTPSISFSQTYGWNGATSGAGTVTTYSKSAFSMSASTGASLNTSTGVISWGNNTSTSVRSTNTVSVTLTGSGGKTATVSAKASQKAGSSSTNTRYSSWVTGSLTVTASATTIGAGGGSATMACKANQTRTKYIDTLWNGIVTNTTSSGESQSIDVTPTWSKSGDGTLSSTTAKNPTLTYPSRGTAVAGERSTTVSASYDGKSGSVVVKQGANAATSITYGTPTVSLSVADIPAGGGTVSSGTVSYSQSRTQNYTSGSTSALSALTSGGTVTYGASVTASSLGTTVKARTSTGKSLTVSVKMHDKTGSASATVYQAENKVTNSNYKPRITAYGTPSISIGSGITAGGGSATVSASVSNTQTYNALYSSGSTGPNQTRSVAGSVTLSLVSNGNSRFSLSGSTLSHSSMTTNLTTDSATVRATNANSTTLTKDASVSVTNSRDVTGTSGGVYTYYDVSAGAIANKTIPAGGGNATATAGNGSQRVTRTAITTSYKYTSGSTSSAVTTAASDVTNAISPSVASKYGSAGSKGTTVSGVTTVARQAVTWSGQGNKSASGTMYVYQAANSLTWNNPVVSMSYSDISAGGSTVTPSVSITQSGSYTSGSSASNTTIGSKSFSGTSVNTSTGAVTRSSLGTTVKARTKITTATVSVTANGKRGSKSADVYQAANAATTITYGVPSVSVSASDVPAKGGSVTSGTVTYSQSRTQNYTSGSTSALSALTSGGSVSWSGGASNIPSLGTTVKARTAVGSALKATVTMNKKSGSGSVTVYQAANAVSSYGSWADTFTLSATNVSEDSDYVTYSGSSSRSRTYTSGSSDTETSAIQSVTSAESWATVSGDRISVSANGSPNARTTVLTCTYANSRTKTATLRQNGVQGNIYVQVHNKLSYTINWQAAFTLTLDRNYVSANGYSSYYSAPYGSDSISTEPVGVIVPANAGLSLCTEIKVSDFTIHCTNSSGSYVGRNFTVWVEVEKRGISTGANKTLSTAGSSYSPIISNGTTGSTPVSSSNVRCSPMFYTAEAGRYIIHVEVS